MMEAHKTLEKLTFVPSAPLLRYLPASSRPAVNVNVDEVRRAFKVGVHQ
jgi:hypothetical protein